MVVDLETRGAGIDELAEISLDAADGPEADHVGEPKTCCHALSLLRSFGIVAVAAGRRH
jgi:hypothetical protein